VARTLVVTNDFPPRKGGIQTFVHELLRRFPPEDVVVYCSTWKGAQEFDADQPFTIIREDTSVLLPRPSVRHRAVRVLQEYGCESVLFGAAAPLGLLAPALRAAGASRLVGLTHGHEAGWAGYPVMRQVLRRVGDGLDVTTYLGSYTRDKIAGAYSEEAASRMVQLTPGVDADAFRPNSDAGAVRARYGLDDRPVVVCVSRLMPRKGQDTLIAALPRIRRAVPDTALLLVGGGPYRAKLQAQADASGMAEHVVITGGVPFAELPLHYAVGDVFAMPCRTRRRGLDVEGLGIVYLEASACGLPVVAGDSGGAPDAVLPGETGFVVDGEDRDAVADTIGSVLGDRERRQSIGQRGREWVLSDWRWADKATELRALLRPAA
jgi:phosphatidylinositol alpha-1,6-mannosyltransferase